MKLIKCFLPSRSVKFLFLRTPGECEAFFFFHIRYHCIIIGSKNFEQICLAQSVPSLCFLNYEQRLAQASQIDTKRKTGVCLTSACCSSECSFIWRKLKYHLLLSFTFHSVYETMIITWIKCNSNRQFWTLLFLT